MADLELFRATALDAIMEERDRAHAKHGPLGQSMETFAADDRRFLPVFTEEVLEAAREWNDLEFKPAERAEVMQRFRAELVQVAAVACAWVDSIDRASG